MGQFVTEREYFIDLSRLLPILFPNRNFLLRMKYTPKQVGELIKQTRKGLAITQEDLAMTSGTGLRFIIELEQGKPTCQLGKALTVLNTLGVSVELIAPASAKPGALKLQKEAGT